MFVLFLREMTKFKLEYEETQFLRQFLGLFTFWNNMYGAWTAIQEVGVI